MKFGPSIAKYFFLFFLVLSVGPAFAQYDPAMDRPVEAAIFAAGTGTYTGSLGGQNIAFTGGVDVGFNRLTYRGFLTSLELRGSYPIYHGHIDSLSNVLGGVKIEKRIFGRYHPYGDIGYGEGNILYAQNGIYNPVLGGRKYKGADTPVLSGGLGNDFDLKPYLAFKTELLMQKYNTPVAVSGHNWAMATSFALVYRFGYRNEELP